MTLEEQIHGDSLTRLQALLSTEGRKIGYFVVEGRTVEYMVGAAPDLEPLRYFFTPDFAAAADALRTGNPVQVTPPAADS